MSVVYLDSCVIIYLVEGRPALQARIEKLLGAATSICVSELSRLETRLGPMKSGDTPTLRSFDGFFDLASVAFVDLDRRVYERATSIRAKHGLRTPDALHVAAALEHGCDQLWTNDQRLIRLDLGLSSVCISVD